MRRLMLLAAVASMGCVETYTRRSETRNWADGKILSATPGDKLIAYEDCAHSFVDSSLTALNAQQFEEWCSRHAGLSCQTSCRGFDLTYLGPAPAGKVLRLRYREYSNAMARPVFDADLLYDAEPGRVIVFRGIRLRIISASDEGITVEALPRR